MKKKTLLFLILGCLVILVFRQCYLKIEKGLENNKEIEQADLPYSTVLPEDYSALFIDSNLSKNHILIVQNSKSKNPVAALIHDNKYEIFIYKMDLRDERINLSSFIHNEFKSVTERDLTEGGTYKFIDGPGFQFEYNGEPDCFVSKFNLIFSGDSLLNTIKNGSVMNFHLLCDNFLVRYDENAEIKILIDRDKKTDFNTNLALIPLDILFLKRCKSIYFITLSSLYTEKTSG
jgi:hypothetical protein